MDMPLTTGSAGMVLLLTAFLLNLMGRLEEDTVAYTGLNLVGAVLLAIYAYWLATYPFLVLELVWAGAAGYRLVHAHSGDGGEPQ